MPTLLVSLFVFLHGLAHMVYTAVARGWIPAPENQPEMTGNSWLLAAPLGASATREAGAVAFTGISLAFAVAALSLGLRLPWAPSLLAVCAVVSTAALLIFWDGRPANLVTQGLLGAIINLTLIVSLYLRWPLSS